MINDKINFSITKRQAGSVLNSKVISSHFWILNAFDFSGPLEIS